MEPYPLSVMPVDDVAVECHVLPLPRMCPVSGNPQPGSWIAVRYRPAGRALEVYALADYLERYIGGWLRDGAHIRDMEQTIATIAADCTAAVGVAVTVRARLVLDAGRMGLRVTRAPTDVKLSSA